MIRYVLVCATLVVSSCGDDSNDTNNNTGTCTETTSVSIKNLAFSPACIKITHGATVTFKNDETNNTPHTATSDPGQAEMANSPTLDPGESYAFTFNTVGTNNIHCEVHPGMRMKVEIQ